MNAEWGNAREGHVEGVVKNKKLIMLTLDYSYYDNKLHLILSPHFVVRFQERTITTVCERK